MIAMKLVDYQYVSTDEATKNKNTHYRQVLVPGKFSDWYKEKEKEIPSIKVTGIFYDVDEQRKNAQ